MSAIPWFFATIIWLPIAFAGALGFVPLVGILGISALFFQKNIQFRPYMGVFIVALVYAACTSIWSPYTTPLVEIDFSKGDFHVKSAVLRVALITLFGGIALAGAQKVSKAKSKLVVEVFSVIILLQAISLVIIHYFYSDVYNFFEPLITDQTSATLNLSRNVSAFGIGATLLIAIFRHVDNTPKLRDLLLSTGFALFSAYYCQSLSASAAASAILLAWAFMFLPGIFGKYTFRILGCATAGFIVLSPIVFSSFIEVLGDRKETLEASYLWRIEIWTEVLRHMSEKPFWGQGLDALRTYDAVFEDGIWEGQRIIPLHAHNMFLHIWIETGYVGVWLTALSVLLMGNRLPAPADLGPKAAAAICGLWAACLIICNFSFSLWNDWWWALIVVVIGFVSLIHNAWSDEVA
ncbi:O-antigen ligase family protein [Hirschia baltica]|uniref:O-antigen polymerase n=1 Tax=Hirschia baltica (strain ATCC 49814 / DSM 5838 / IFAM 1418) TaxID=582402 RepID=C6XNA2_HIRBI|nr:O-antigen ligase family protein [Hirschia baltica]ACT60046.1 O-antigen polymerase [Hirschia baltica ATCC 49814]